MPTSQGALKHRFASRVCAGPANHRQSNVHNKIHHHHDSHNKHDSHNNYQNNKEKKSRAGRRKEQQERLQRKWQGKWGQWETSMGCARFFSLGSSWLRMINRLGDLHSEAWFRSMLSKDGNTFPVKLACPSFFCHCQHGVRPSMLQCLEHKWSWAQALDTAEAEKASASLGPQVCRGA